VVVNDPAEAIAAGLRFASGDRLGGTGVEWSGYVAPTHLVIKDNIGCNGGPNNVYDPDNG
jgi:hypothetical protein